MAKKKLLILTLMVFVLCAFTKVEAGIFSRHSSESDSKEGKVTRVGIVLSVGGLGDNSFNDMAYSGLKKAEKELGIEMHFMESKSTNDDEEHLRMFAEANFNLIIATGFLMQESCTKVAKDYPDKNFAIIDSVIDLPNVASLVFKEDEGSFLVGALAGMMTKNNVVGFIGGMDVPIIRKFHSGYEAGVKYVNPRAKVVYKYTTGDNPFNDPEQGKVNTKELIKEGADVIYHASGGTGLGVIEAARESGKYAIGVDNDQDWMAPGTVLTSMLKRVDVAVYRTVAKLLNGELNGEINSFGIAEGGVGTTDFKYTRDEIPYSVLSRLESIKNKIIDGEIEF